MKSNFLQFFFSKNYKKMEFHEQNSLKYIFNRWGMLMRIIFVQFTLYITEQDKKTQSQ